MKIYELIAPCQNQWKKDALLTLNENFKLEIRTNEKKYILDVHYTKDENWLKIREKLVMSFWIEKDTLTILTLN